MSLLQDVQDSRGAWERFRRRELYAIATIEGINFVSGCPATTMRILLQDHNVSPQKYSPQTARLSDPRPERINVSKKFLKTEEPSQEVIEEAREEIKTLDPHLLKMHELRTWCKNHGIKVMPTDKKETLISKVKATIDGENAT